MIAMIEQILDAFSSFVQFLGSIINGLLQIISVIGQFVAFIFELVAVAPPFMSAFLIAGVTASILFLLLGRN